MIRGIVGVVIALLAHCVSAETLKVGVSFAIPPYVIREDSGGIELNLLREALAETPYRLSFHYLPLRQTFELMEQGKLDAIINVKPGMLKRGYLSAPVITFYNRVFTLAPRRIKRLDELAGLHLVAFPKAREILGADFDHAAALGHSYQEQSRQAQQVRQLFEGRAQAIVLERRIFEYYRAHFARQSPALYHRGRAIENPLFAPTVYHFAFGDPKVRDRFDAGLRHLRTSGRYQTLVSGH
ncbi:transporter substrate-binding domain-containing protein [Aeromonas diversa]|uniref:transporter substrate-binding domain-containing protein n=1 Tax=Aeromonas diversa TaxID=502790 RepID=UPI0034621EA1